ncbi:alpha-1,4-glucan--maltose-1-phosphate maltosyltransferase [Pseudomonas sp. UL073]|uniref:Alpha-1,4-glucan:maltose-1-phosphate maltosyltransferase n=1 Tax=Zestomonas insulae TaxID=2809017 RepID=A0ABS2IGM3_9GAMM|nr:alpha-1,4-glucan--maltose-1-phosphate maltosyltransferase [Pseudomonas insulae]MBM7061905.1 alpha-1,4-glucan--maltose-1-phosphate maltosyltransferase [Pseudomonas insulae]
MSLESYRKPVDTLSGSLRIEEAIDLPRIAIEAVSPTVEGGRFAAKAIAGRTLTVRAVLIADGHDKLGARVVWRELPAGDWQHVPLKPLGNDRWEAHFVPPRACRLAFAVEAWWDVYASYADELKKKYAAGVPISLEVHEGELLLEKSAKVAHGEHAAALQGVLTRLRDTESLDRRVGVLLAPETARAMAQVEAHPHRVRSALYPLEVERRLAEFASWYELFPRSASNDEQRHGTFRDVIERLPEIAEMGFDVLYFPPIHPIGRTHRKGRNNALTTVEGDPGSPYAIGSEEGGHEALHAELGSFEDFRALVAAAREQGLEIALDFAIQCSPDHPWLKQHPGWFSWRPDGSIRHAENPPKKYEDIVNVDFYAADAMPELWLALRDVVVGWVEQGVSLFRVDNPHTKPLPFWEWLIADVRGRYPQTIFLAEAFTRPAMMARLGKVGFSQSYTYFTWRNSKAELQEYLEELNEAPLSECYRPNFFVNTPDINPYFLQTSGRAGFLIRAALATMGSGLWGMYSGFEICEAAPVPGKEEYLDSEKYQLRIRDYRAPGNIVAEIAQLNRIRRQNPALQTHLGFQAYTAWNEHILYFGKRSADRSNFILVAISLDPHNAQEAHFELPLWELGLADDAATEGEDLMNGHTWTWYGKVQWMRIEPWVLPFGIWRIRVPGDVAAPAAPAAK